MAVELKHRPHYTTSDYEHWEGRWELIQGLPYAMSPAPNLRHQRTSQSIAALLDEVLAECSACTALLPVDWKIAEDTVVQPDNLVICTEAEGQYLTEPPVLIFEVLSPSTAYKDRTLKKALYEEQGVRHYVLVDPEARVAEVFELRGGVYAHRGDVQEGPLDFDLGPCRVTLRVDEIQRVIERDVGP